MTTPLLATLVTALTGLVVALGTRPVLQRLPEPTETPAPIEAETLAWPEAGTAKVPYKALGTVGFVAAATGIAVLAQVAAWLVLPRQVQPLWTVLALSGVLLALIDARTTWLPLALTRVAWLLMGLAVVLAWPLGATRDDTVRTLAGALVAGGFYFVVWSVTHGGFGFGDVRFAPLLGAATASQSWTLFLWGLSLGTVVGAAHACVRLVRRLPGGFPYAPSMLGGVYLAAVLHYLVWHWPG